jgi:hypothetical protein
MPINNLSPGMHYRPKAEIAQPSPAYIPIHRSHLKELSADSRTNRPSSVRKHGSVWKGLKWVFAMLRSFIDILE